MRNLLKKKGIVSSSAIALALSASLVVSGCTNPTSTAGSVSYFTEGVITDIEYITIDLNHYNTKNTAAVGGIAGAAAGQILGGNSCWRKYGNGQNY